MMMKFEKKQLIIYIFVLTLICALKKPYIPDVISSYSSIAFDIVIFYSKNYYINFIWFIPIATSSFILSSGMYYRLIRFDLRFKNRERYFLKILKTNILNCIIFTILTAVIQWILFMLIFKFNIKIDKVLFLIIMKYATELFLIITIIVFISLMINNFIYSYMLVISLTILLISSLKLEMLPLVNLYIDYNIRLFDILLVCALLYIMRIVYNRKDLGGVRNEIDS